MDVTLTDPTREETKALAEVISEALNQPCDGYWMSVAEDGLRAANRVRLRDALQRATEETAELAAFDALAPLGSGVDRVGAVLRFEADIAGEQALDRVLR